LEDVVLIATHLELSNVGPFLGREIVELGRGCTVVTGANDVGKTWLLRAFEHFVLGKPVQELDVNLQYLKTDSPDWKTDRGISIAVQFIYENDEKDLVLNIDGTKFRLMKGKHERFRVEYFAAPGVNKHQVEIGDTRHVIAGRSPVVELVTVSLTEHLADGLMIGYVDDISDLSQRLLDYAFGETGRFQKIVDSLKYQHVRASRIHAANSRLNDLFERVLPTFRQRLKFVEISPEAFRLDIQEGNDDSTPLLYRSAGFKKLLSFRLQVYFSGTGKRPLRLALCDEPELSLHAAAQHHLRAAFEEMCKTTPMQMVYVTHSPSMINRLNPSTVRVVRREQTRHEIGLELAHSRVDKYSPGDNFLSVRTSLGLSAADSLLYGPIVVVVEGDTELICLERILRSIAVTDREVAALSLTVMMDGKGAPNLLQWCHRVESFGETAIAFADGDKRTDIEREYRKNNYQFAMILLDDGREFEDLVSPHYYFECLSLTCQTELKIEDFKEWGLKQAEWFQRKAFSKRIEDWLIAEREDLRYSKQLVMETAVLRDPEFEQWDLEPIRRLLSQIVRVAVSKSLLLGPDNNSNSLES